MPIALACPKCHAPQTIPDEAAGQTVRCPSCQTEFPATPPAPPTRANRRVGTATIVLLLLVGVAVVAGAMGYQYYHRSTPSDFTDPDGMFSARFPNPPEAATVSKADPMALKWGEQVYRTTAGGKDYAVSVLDGVNAGDQAYGPVSRDAHINEAFVILMTNADGKQLADRPVVHEGHPAREVVFVRRDNGKLTALRILAGEHHILRLSVTGSGDEDKPTDFLDAAAAFWNGVHVGSAFGPPIVDAPPTVSAADLAAEYKADAGAADAKYKDRWLRVTGPVREVAKDGTEFVMTAGDGGILVRRAARGRRTAQVRGPMAMVTTTGKCRGLTAAGPRVLLEDAIVDHQLPKQ